MRPMKSARGPTLSVENPPRETRGEAHENETKPAFVVVCVAAERVVPKAHDACRDPAAALPSVPVDVRSSARGVGACSSRAAGLHQSPSFHRCVSRLSSTDHPRLGTTPPLEADAEPRTATCARSRRRGGRVGGREGASGQWMCRREAIVDGRRGRGTSSRRDVRVRGMRLPWARTVPRSARTTRGDLHRRDDAGVASASRSATFSPWISILAARLHTPRVDQSPRTAGGFGISTGVTRETPNR